MATSAEQRQQNGHSDPRAQLEQIIDNLLIKIWEIMVQLNEYDSYNSEKKWAISHSLKDLIDYLDEVNRLQEKIKHIEVPMTGRNPDIFMSEYVEEVMTENQAVNVKNDAIIDFKDLLLEQLQETLPEQTNAYKKYVQANDNDLPTTNGH
ncbi:11532_t:CDS:2 [Diversispora eburnea]|uniref:Mediator of RNA polymerase II transcription subunit 10 n=1 Tax=Diversispora eburnea TaxID=1213867 RepID=A0A9N9AT51_9GLOM|nr:11532_t:CDS:2 [Diversispora eburnea]